MYRLIYVVAIAAVALAGALASTGLFSGAPGTVAVVTPASTTGYTPTPGFEYFPAQYQIQATKIEGHVENF